MVKVTMRTNGKGVSPILDENTTLRQALEDQGFDYTRGNWHLDGAALTPGDIDKSFADFGIGEKCFLISIVKADNA